MELANSIVTLQPGMYILRHPKTGMPPISISKAAARVEHNGQIQALYTPGTDGAVLRDGKDCIVMQVLQAPVDLLVTAYLDKAGAAVPSLKVDKIALETDSPASAKAFEIARKGITIIGHVERAGDLAAMEGQTLGAPESNLRLEGFQVMWPDKPDGIELSYSAQIEGIGSTPTVRTGEFCGTRGAARRITETTFALSGSLASEFELGGIAHFSGGFACAIQDGARMHGPTGLEHLSGLSLSVTRKSAQKPGAPQNPWEPSPRTRVLRRTSNATRRGK